MKLYKLQRNTIASKTVTHLRKDDLILNINLVNKIPLWLLSEINFCRNNDNKLY